MADESRRPYDYGTRTGVHLMAWDEFGRLCRVLAKRLEARDVDMIVGIARAGLLSAAAVAAAMRVDLAPAQLTRRERAAVVRDRPEWRVGVSDTVAGRRVAVIDDVADTGETLRLAADRARERGAADVCTATLLGHSWADPQPDEVALPSDALIVFPWDAQVCVDGAWATHPELAEVLQAEPPADPAPPSGA